MKQPRFLIMVAGKDKLPADAVNRMAHSLAAIGGFTPVWSGSRSVMFAQTPAIPFEHGAIVGAIFKGGTSRPLDSFSTADGNELKAGKGQTLVDTHWGNYVGLIERENSVFVVRAPLGALPCLVANGANGLVIASDVPLLEIAGCHIAVDYRELVRHLAAPDLRHAETCLAGVTEVQGGLRLEITDDKTRTGEIWSPWKSACREGQVNDPSDARRRVRDAVLHAVAASCRPHASVVLRLSGGLDSSIVAAALADAHIATVALNLVTDDAAGDERYYARLAAKAAGIELVERSRTIDAVDLRLSAAATLPRPTGRAFVQSALRHANALAVETGADAIVDGGGGDNVFCSLQSIRPVIDCLTAGTGWRRAVDTARSVATLSQVSQWTVLRGALIGRARHLSRYTFALDCRLLSWDAAVTAVGAADHRWLDSPTGALPGKAAHVGLIAAAQSVVEGFDPLDQIPLVSPLISQPVVETCLSIPSWFWFDRGYNRAIARDAFADRLPAAIVKRRSKGGPDAFIAELYRHNRRLIGETLMDGLLVTHGLIDRGALGLALAEQGPVQRHDFLRVMQLMDAEAWARCHRG